ncbi:MAG: FHA domain-containing protein [Anaerolineae bacterium]
MTDSHVLNHKNLIPPTAHLSQNTVDFSNVVFEKDETLQPFPNKKRTLHLHMPQSMEPIVLIDIKKITVGRVTGENYLDLSLHFAKMLGVSREHATITYENGHYYVTDLGSTNGTFLNNEKLTSHKPYRLQHSDHISFGLFVMIVSFG